MSDMQETRLTLRIATWNLDRPKTRSVKNAAILARLAKEDADIFVLTETNRCIDLEATHRAFSSCEVVTPGRWQYTEGEHRVTIWAKRRYDVIGEPKTRDPESSVSVTLKTNRGPLHVYGTVLGALGRPTRSDLHNQITDWERLGRSTPICIAGDFNTSFLDSYHFTHEARNRISESFKVLEIANLTEGVEKCIDHIAVTKTFYGDGKPKIHEWNLEKSDAVPRLSDHKGISVDLS